MTETTRVSDFKVAENFLRAACRSLNVPFVDVGVTFNEEPGHTLETSYDGEHVIVGSTDHLGKTMLLIVANYLSALDYIVGQQVNLDEQRESRMIATASTVIRDFMYSDSALPEAWEKPVPKVSLSHFPFVWLTLRDLIVPLYDAELRDIPVVLDRSPRHDVATLGQMKAAGSDQPEPVIFVNTSVESDAYRSAFLLVTALKAYGLDPKPVVMNLLASPEVSEKAFGFAKLAFVNEKVASEFAVTLAAVAGLQDPVGAAGAATSRVWVKQANSPTQGIESMGLMNGGAWANVQLLETMIDPARGPDFTVKKILDPISQRVWKRVSDEKERRGKADMSLEDMLRVHGQPFKVKPNVLLQGLLSQERIW